MPDNFSYVKPTNYDRVLERAEEARKKKATRARELGCDWESLPLEIEASIDTSSIVPGGVPDLDTIEMKKASIQKDWDKKTKKKRAGSGAVVPATLQEVQGNTNARGSFREDY